MGEALERGMVLIFSIWNSAGDFMNWMDSGDAGPCNATEGDPKLILANQPDTHVTWVSTNEKWHLKTPLTHVRPTEQRPLGRHRIHIP